MAIGVILYIQPMRLRSAQMVKFLRKTIPLDTTKPCGGFQSVSGCLKIIEMENQKKYCANIATLNFLVIMILMKSNLENLGRIDFTVLMNGGKYEKDKRVL